MCGMCVTRADRRWICILLSLALVTSCVMMSVYYRTGSFHRADVLANSSWHKDVPVNQELEVVLQYAAVIDAGSSGSRIFLYTWPPHTGNPRDLLVVQPVRAEDGEPLQKKVSPGLSSVSSRPWDATAYMAPLLRFAAASIPKEKHKETPLYILATAGMRMLGKTEQDAILDNLRVDIPRNFSFYFPANNVEIISGKQEGVYQWIAINFALGKFDHSHANSVVAVDSPVMDSESSSKEKVFRPQTVGAMDMGGASLQVAFEITSTVQRNGLDDHGESQLVEINLGCREHDREHVYTLYVATFLGYGANEILQRHQATTALQGLRGNSSSGTDIHKPVSDPCLPRGMDDNVTLALDSRQLPEKMRATFSKPSNFSFIGTGDWDACYGALQQHTQREKSSAPCTASPCPTPAGLRMPAISYHDSHFYGFSEFWYTLEDVLRMGGLYKFDKFHTAAKDFCSTRWSTLADRYEKKLYPKADVHRFRYQCFKSAWLAVVIHEGLKFPKQNTPLTASPNSV